MAEQIKNSLNDIIELVERAASSDASARDIRTTINTLNSTIAEYEKNITEATFSTIKKNVKSSKDSLNKFLTADCMAKTFGKDKQALLQARVYLQEAQSSIYSQIMGASLTQHKELVEKCNKYESQIKAEEEKKANMQATLNGEMSNLKSQLAQAFAGTNQREAEKKQLAESHAGEVEKMKDAHQGELNSLKAAHEGAIADLKSSHDSALAALKTEHEGALAAAKKSGDEALKASTDSYEAKLAEKDSLIKEKDSTIAEKEGALKAKNDEVTALQAEKSKMEGDHAKALKSAQEEGEKAKNSAVDAVKGDLSAANDKLKSVESDLSDAKKKIKSLESDLEAAKAAAAAGGDDEQATKIHPRNVMGDLLRRAQLV